MSQKKLSQEKKITLNAEDMVEGLRGSEVMPEESLPFLLPIAQKVMPELSTLVNKVMTQADEHLQKKLVDEGVNEAEERAKLKIKMVKALNSRTKELAQRVTTQILEDDSIDGIDNVEQLPRLKEDDVHTLLPQLISAIAGKQVARQFQRENRKKDSALKKYMDYVLSKAVETAVANEVAIIDHVIRAQIQKNGAKKFLIEGVLREAYEACDQVNNSDAKLALGVYVSDDESETHQEIVSLAGKLDRSINKQSQEQLSSFLYNARFRLHKALEKDAPALFDGKIADNRYFTQWSQAFYENEVCANELGV